ncbi:hypothetical protein JCM9534A_36090 [Catenuloplanes indicus JCM 9534]
MDKIFSPLPVTAPHVRVLQQPTHVGPVELRLIRPDHRDVVPVHPPSYNQSLTTGLGDPCGATATPAVEMRTAGN